MEERVYTTDCGDIHYWLQIQNLSAITLIFLPGLTADHRLFDKQLEYFEGKHNVFVWDAPGHAASRPFTLNFDLMQKAEWLEEILLKEGIERPVIIGQSMGGYVGQAYAHRYPERLKGFVSIDSAPLQRVYTTWIEIWLLKKMEPVYRYWPWKSLFKLGTNGVATTEYGRSLMRDIMRIYEGDQAWYAKLSGHGFAMLANAMEADLPYEIHCPVILICGDKDAAGSAKSYNKRWHKRSGIPLFMIADAGHNSNTDKPAEVNALIEDLLKKVS